LPINCFITLTRNWLQQMQLNHPVTATVLNIIV